MASDDRHSGDSRQRGAGSRRATARRSATKQERAAERLERAADRLNEKLVRHEISATRAIERAQQQLDRASEQLGALEVWTRKMPVSRKPRFTRDELAATAIRIADDEGFDAVSMRRIAAELESGTMTLYHYVRTKDELLSLVVDAIMAEIVVPADEFPTDWRAALRTIAQCTRAALLRHPWILDITDDPPVGPHTLRHFDQSMQAVASLPYELQHKLDIVGAVDAYVFGFCLHDRNNMHAANDPFATEMLAYVNELIDSGDYPQLRALVDEYGYEGTWTRVQQYASDESRFDRGLERLLDGFETELERNR
jgi:AcrR family transcriptional regulator